MCDRIFRQGQKSKARAKADKKSGLRMWLKLKED
jgi:hypothetical protein